MLLGVRIRRGSLLSRNLEYSLFAEQTRNKYKMSPEDYLAGKGLNIKIEIL